MSWIGITEAQAVASETAGGSALPLARRARIALASFVSSRAAFVICVALGPLLASPSLFTGWVADDLLHQSMLREGSGIPGLAHRSWDLFRFASGDARAARQLMDAGVFPWWADPHARLAFFRPLASWTHWLDYQLWPRSPASMHLQSLLWFGALLAVVGAIYRRFLTPRAAHFALLLFALDDAHAPAAGWIANRNALMALGLSLWALLLHDRFRREGSRLAGWLGPLALAAGLGAGEAALITCAYLLAYAVFLDRGSARQRYGSLLRYAAVVCIWRVISQGLGYGVAGSGLYIDPISSPLAFTRLALERLPVLLLAQLAVPWADFWELFPLVAPVLSGLVFALAIVVIAAFVRALWPLWREQPQLRFWALGTVLALLPVCATFAHDRLLLGAGIGAMPLVAALLVFAARARKWPLLVTLGAIHLALAPLLLALRAAHVGDLSRALSAADESIPSGPDVAQKSVVLLNPPLDPFAAYLPFYRQAAGRTPPQRLLWLSTGVTELLVSGVDARTIRVRARDGFLSSASQCMLRDPRRPPRLGETIELGAARLLVVASMPDGRPKEIEVRFRTPLASEQLLWMQWRGHGYAPFRPPTAGESVVVPKLDIASALFG